MSDRASWYGADGRLRVAEWREGFEDTFLWQNPGWQDVFEEYRYDALGRRVLVMSRQECMFGTDSSAIQDCRISRVRRTVWDGSRELWEIQMPARPQDSLLVENDTAPVTYTSGLRYDGIYSDPNPLFGRVAYTYAMGVDQPLSVTRINLVRRKDTTDTKYWNPVELHPHWNWRGEADMGTFQDGGMVTCTDSAHCVFVQWRGLAFATGLTTELLWTQHNHFSPSPYGWFGTLVNDKVDGTGTFYRRNRYVDPMTGRFTQEDPVGLAGGLNLYGFANGDPVSFGDPFGLGPCSNYPQGHCPVWLQAAERAQNALNSVMLGLAGIGTAIADFFSLGGATNLWKAGTGFDENGNAMSTGDRATAAALGLAGFATMVPGRALTAAELGVQGVTRLEGSFAVEGGQALAQIDKIEARGSNPFAVINRLKEMAKAEGASSLTITGTLGNERLFNVLVSRYGLQSAGGVDFIVILIK